MQGPVLTLLLKDHIQLAVHYPVHELLPEQALLRTKDLVRDPGLQDALRMEEGSGLLL